MGYDIRAIQMRELEILKQVAQLCRDNGLRFFLTSGTCLGAVRHKGFIPWDDDIDIGMPRKDFDEFRRIAPAALPEHLALLDFERERQDVNVFLKVHDKRTTFIEKGVVNSPGKHTGVFVDVFPYDGCPSGREAQDRLRRRLAFLIYLNKLLRMNKPTPPFLALKKAAVRAMQLVLPWNWASMRLENILRGYDMDGAETVMVDWKMTVLEPGRCFRQLTELPFEDTVMPCPGDYDAYLTEMYGDYMQLPPEEKRCTEHNVAYLSLEKSYLTRWWEEPDQASGGNGGADGR